MAFGRIPAPVHNEVSSVLYFAKSTRHFTTQLGSDFGGTVSKRCVTVQQPSQSVGQRDGFSLRFTGGVAQSVNQRHVSVMQVRCGRFDSVVHRGFVSVDQSVWIVVVRRMIQEPRLAEDAGFPGFVDSRLVEVKLNVVADAAAERTCRVVDDVETHSVSSPDSVMINRYYIVALRRIRPNRTKEQEMFNQAPDRDCCRGHDAA